MYFGEIYLFQNSPVQPLATGLRADHLVRRRSVPSARSCNHQVGGGLSVSPTLQDNCRGENFVLDRHGSIRLSEYISRPAVHAGNGDDPGPRQQPRGVQVS